MALLLAAGTGFTSCTFEDDDYFDESASLRIQNFNDSVQSTLVNSDYGWVMQYFTGTQNYHFEGFNLFAKFEDSGKVLIAGDHRYLRDGNANTYTEDESTYSMLEEDGPVLAFNTWNDVLTVFADPVNPFYAPNTLVNDGAGMNGDYNYDIASYSENEVNLLGERYQGPVRMIKCTMPWADYISQTTALKNYVANTSITNYYIICGTDTLYFSGLRGGRIRYSERTVDPLQNDSVACCFTPNGFHLSEELTIGETTFQDFTLAEDSTMLVSEDGAVQCMAMWDYYIANRTTLWAFDQTLFTTAMTEAFQAINDALKDYNSNYELVRISLGKSTGGNSVTGVVLTFYTNANQTRTNTCGLSLDMAQTGFGQMSFTVPESPSMDQNLTSMSRRATNLPTAISNFSALIAGTYNMTPNNYFLPTGATYTSVDGSKTFALEYTE